MQRFIKKLHFGSIDSTQTWAKKYHPSIVPNLLLCIYADEQTLGKGTNGKTWESPKDVNLYFTLVFSLSQRFRYLANISQVVSLSVISTLTKYGFSPKCKWPNDVLLNQKKVAGILTEVQTQNIHSMIYTGIGLDVNMTEEQQVAINQEATSLLIESGKTWDKEELLNMFLEILNQDLSLFESKGFPAFKNRYFENLIYQDKDLILYKESKELKGKVVFVDDEGRLCFETQEKETFLISGQDRLKFVEEAL